MRFFRLLVWTGAAGLLGFAVAPAQAQDQDEAHDAMGDARRTELERVRAEVADLNRRAESLEAQRDTMLRREIEDYLDRAEAQGGGGGVAGVTLHATFTATGQATVGSDPANAHSVIGDVELRFDFDVTDNLDLFLRIVGNDGGDFPSEFGAIAGDAGATLSGLGDGIGVNGNVSTSPGSARVHEAGFVWSVPIRDRALHVKVGKIEPRDNFAQNRFANDPRTQFLNNLFDDPSAISWRTNATGTTIYGIMLWMNFGRDSQYRFDVAYFDEPGRFFDRGQVLFQVSWTGDVSGREMNIRIFAQIDGHPDDVSAGAGTSIDWWATEKIGVFFRAAVRDNEGPGSSDPNPIESSWEVGGVFNGLVPNRPDDTLGVAWGLIKGPIRAFVPDATENSEMVIEVYYRFMCEDGRLQITPNVQYVIDPGAGSFADGDDLLLLGVRIHVPF